MPEINSTPISDESITSVLKGASSKLASTGSTTPRLDAELLLSHTLEIDRTTLISDSRRKISHSEVRLFNNLIERRLQREPIAYIIGSKHFRSLELFVDRRVLIPRPETEDLVEVGLTLPHGVTVVDVGTGSGAVALALKGERPDFTVIGVDKSSDALDVARENCQRLGIEIELINGDLLKALARREIYAVISNPPYIADGDQALEEGVRHFEPHSALYAGEDGLAVYKRLIPEAAEASVNLIALEVGVGQAAHVVELLRSNDYSTIEVRPDLAGIERVIVGSKQPDKT
jgi:release factor glutamine methyltransferase